MTYRITRRSLMSAAAAAPLAALISPQADAAEVAQIWRPDNLLAWDVVPFDARKRTPVERAKMLAQLGFKHFAYDWRVEHIPTFDDELNALKAHGIALDAWWFPMATDSPLGRETLELFSRHGVRPTLWVMQGDTPAQVRKADALLPADLRVPRDPREAERLSDPERKQIDAAMARAWEELGTAPRPKNAKEQEVRVGIEAERFAQMRADAERHGCRVALYSHNGWFGAMDNQLAIIERLRDRGIDDIGLVFNFAHAHDAEHDDTFGFGELWPRIQAYVTTVNIAGTHQEDGSTLLPGQGLREADMMRVIQRSGWNGRVGVIAESGGDARATLAAARDGLERIAARIAP